MADTDTPNNGYETNDWVCQQNSATIMRSANIPEEEKSEVKFFFLHNQKYYSFFHCKVLELHLDLATKARSYLKAKVTILKLYTGPCQLLVLAYYLQATTSPCTSALTWLNRFVNSDSYVPSYETITILQVHYPSNPQQPGPVYFLTPRKCGIFSTCCEAITRQVGSF